MDLTYKQEVGVGALVLSGLVLFVVLLFWFSGKSLSHSGVYAHVVFANVAGLKEGDPVMVSGVKKGRVAKVALERVGHVTVTLELSGDVRPRMDAGAAVTSLDFFGAKYIDYFPGTPEKDWLPDRSVITGTKAQELTDLASGVATRANELIGNATGLVSEQLAVDIHNTLIATQRGMAALTETAQGPLVKQTSSALQMTEHVMARLDTLLGAANVKQTGLRIDTLTANLRTLTDQLAQSTQTVNTLITRINHGEGTLGKMATDSSLYTDLHETLQAMTKLMNDLRERPGRYLTVKVF
jgi:phospholipid/cholesterol/gamma-HCH transport system substrate-binding protein